MNVMDHPARQLGLCPKKTVMPGSIFSPICAIGCLLLVIPLLSSIPKPSPVGESDRPMVQGALELVLSEGTGQFHGTRIADDDLKPRRKIWLSRDHEIELQITSLDYVYSLTQPTLNLNLVIVPGLPVFVDLRKRPPGFYEMSLNPICGTPWDHSDPPNTIVIVP